MRLSLNGWPVAWAHKCHVTWFSWREIHSLVSSVYPPLCSFLPFQELPSMKVPLFLRVSSTPFSVSFLVHFRCLWVFPGGRVGRVTEGAGIESTCIISPTFHLLPGQWVLLISPCLLRLLCPPPPPLGACQGCCIYTEHLRVPCQAAHWASTADRTLHISFPS